MKKFLSFLLFALCLTVAANAQTFATYDFEDGTIPSDFTNVQNEENYAWIVIDTVDDGGNAVRCIRSSNRGVASSTSAIEITHDFASDGYITFDALCMGEGTGTAWDRCIFYIDGEAQFTYGAHIAGWNHYSYPVTAGSHTFKWVYTKDHSLNYPGDAFFVDNIVFGLGTDPCEVPSNVTVSDITANSATVGWTGNSTEYNVHYRVPGVETDTVFFEDFEDADNFVDGLPNGWTSIDHDGDGYNWIYHNNYGLSSGRITSHSGVGVMYSQSYDFDAGALTPDNWLITPQIELGNIVKVWLTAQDPSYPDEHFAIYLSTTGNDVTDFTVTLLPKTKATGEYVEYTADLRAYAGQQGYIAIRHFNVTDEFYLNVDDFGVYNEELWTTITATGNTAELTDLAPETTYEVQVQGICESGMTEWTEPVMFTTEPAPTCVIDTIEIYGFTEPVYGEHPDYAMSVPDGAHYSIDYVDWNWWNVDEDNGDILGADEFFDNEDNVYYMYFQIIPEDGCTFADNVTVKVNGDENIIDFEYTGYDETDGFFWAYTVDFEVEAPACVITAVNVTGYESPVAGENSQDHLNITVLTVPEDANYSFYVSPRWYDDDADNSFYGIFDEGTHYSVGMTLEANSGCVFDDNCTFYVNGNTTLVDLDYSGVYSTPVKADVWTKSVAATGSTTEPCAVPSNLTATDITDNSATASWTGSQDNYNVRYIRGSIFEDFENGMPANWTTIDADGDGYNWTSFSNAGAESHMYAHSGDGIVYSESYDNDYGPLTPDNYLVSPQIELGGTVRFWACAQDASWAGEHFGLAVSTTGNSDPDDFTTIQEWTMTANKVGGNWHEYTVDLSAYAGQTGYVALRHFNCTDMFILKVDEFGVFLDDDWTTVTATDNFVDLTGLDPETPYIVQVQGICESGMTEWTEPVMFTTEPAPTCVIDTIEIYGFTEPVYGEHPDYAMSVPDGAHYSIDYVDWNWWNVDEDNGDILGADEFFDNEDNVYYMYFQIIPEDGCTFADNVTVKVNGDENIIDFEYTGYDETDGFFWAYTVDFEVEAPASTCVINTIEITGFTEPVYGATPDFDLEVPADADYTLDYITWVESNTHEMNTTETFGAKRYYMVFDIAPNEGCTFADEVTVTINGDASLVDPDYGGILSNVYKYRVFTLDYYLSAPPCDAPSDLSVTDITSNSATVEWTGDMETYNVKYIRGTLFEDFEGGLPSGWTTIDNDADGYDWYEHSSDGAYSHSGTTVMTSESYNYEALYPDNWLITPQIELGNTLRVWLNGQDPSGYDKEHFAIYLSTTGNSVSDFTTTLVGETETTHEWTEYTADLSAYAGQQGYIAIRHFNVTDQFRLNVDDFGVFLDDDWTTETVTGNSIELTGLEQGSHYLVQVQSVCDGDATSLPNSSLWSMVEFTTTEEPACVITEVNVIGYESPVAGENSQDHLNITVPDNANYFLVESAYSPSWYDEDADYFFFGTFVGGAYYSFGGEIHANDGCVFANNCTFLVNGVEDLVDPEFTGVDEDNTIAYIWTMPEQATGTTSPCETPSGLTASNITATTAKLEWTGSQVQYTVRYKEDAASDWTEATTTNSFFALTGLTPETTYTAQVQGDCGTGAKVVTDWSDPVTFTTLSGTIEPGECGPAVDCEGTSYPTVKIGDVCWMAKNLAAETCVTTGNVYAYVNDQFPDEDANVETYGLLYDEEAAFATGICPEGYTLPTTEQFEYLKNNFTVEELRNSTGWVVNTGTNGTGFSWDGSGFYNGTSDNFEHLLMEGYLWAVDMTSGTPQPAMYKMMYYCNEIVRVYDFNGISASIRCVKIAEPQPEPEPEPEPETFTCGTDNLIIGENSYETVQIGTQCWTKTNMRETKDKNGNDFINGISAAAGSFDEYEDAVIYIPTAEKWNENNSSVTYNNNTFGYYYNWTAANNVCPVGWHLPSDEEWTQLETYVSNAQESTVYVYRCDQSDATSIAKALASVTDDWNNENGECYPGDQSEKPNNATGFSAVPAGSCYGSSFYNAGNLAYFWSSTQYTSHLAWYRSLGYHNADVNLNYHYNYNGFSVRCLRDAEE